LICPARERTTDGATLVSKDGEVSANLGALPATFLALTLNGHTLGPKCGYHFRVSKGLCDTRTRTRECSFRFRIELRDWVGLERVAHHFTPYSAGAVAGVV
jgi:hypothetical protein